jgi:hypothetical protein
MAILHVFKTVRVLQPNRLNQFAEWLSLVVRVFRTGACIMYGRGHCIEKFFELV